MAASLERGLEILSFLSKKGADATFGEINAALGGISRATQSRLLKTLMDAGYVYKQPASGLYGCGYAMAQFAAASPTTLRESLIARYQPLMKDIADSFDVSVLLLERIGVSLDTILKVQTATSPNMQGVGAVNANIELLWVKFIYALDVSVPMPDCTVAAKRDITYIRVNGYIYDDQKMKKNFRRLGFPLFDVAGSLLGVLGIGGSILQITDKNRDKLIRFVQAHLSAS